MSVRASLARRNALFLGLAVLVSTSCDRGATETSDRPERSASPAAAGSEAPPAPDAAALVRRAGLAFTDITPGSGIAFRHTTGGTGEKLLPETLGAGAAFLDFDSDGVLDIFLVDSTTWDRVFTRDGSLEPPAVIGDENAPRCRLYRGMGDGTYEDVTDATGCGVSLYGMGCAVGDPDADGDSDIYITAVGDNVLLRNDEGVFRDVTAESGVAGGRWIDRDGVSHPEWSTVAAWLDADGDGWLDLFVGNYVEWSPEHEIFTTLDGVSKAFTTPERYEGLPPRLFRNLGDGTFEDVTTRAGLDSERGKSLGVAVWDIDADGHVDIVVANDTRPNFLLLGDGEGRFRERGLEAEIAYDDTGRARAGMGIDIADYAGDGHAGVVIGNFSREPVSLYQWTAEGVFQPRADAAGIAGATFAPLAFGTRFADVDLDGELDLVIVNGHIEPDIARVSAGERHAQAAQLFLGVGGGEFVDASHLVGEAFARPRVARGLATGDIDGDGDLDLLVTQNGGSPALLRNELSSERHFLRVRLEGSAPNTEAVGAVVRLDAAGARQTRRVRSGSSYASESERVLTFGLGDATDIDAIEVRWPDGVTESYPAPAEVDRTMKLRRVDAR